MLLFIILYLCIVNYEILTVKHSKPIKIHTQVLDLPPYPWQRQRYWLESVSNSQRRCGIADHPLLDLKHEVPHLGMFFHFLF